MSTADSTRFLLQIAVLLAVGLLLGHAARRVRLPAVVGELFGGVLIGPTVLGRLFPQAERWLFGLAGPVEIARQGVLQLALLAFLFVAGLEVNLGQVRRQRWTVLSTSIFGIALPFAGGVLLVRAFPSLWHQPIGTDHLALFMGAALSITALPVIARILLDLNLGRTAFASLVLAAASIDDITGWSLFATVVTAVTTERLLFGRWTTVVFVLALTAFVITIGRKIIERIRPAARLRGTNPGTLIAGAGVLTILLAALLELIGIHALFGAFLAGLAMATGLDVRDPEHEIAHQFALGVLAPIYFVSIGLQADFLRSFDPLLTAMVLGIACIGKIAGATAGAWIGRLPLRTAVAVGFAMNARGAVEIVLASLALQARLIDGRLFVALVLMALITSIVSAPAIRALVIEKRDVPLQPPA